MPMTREERQLRGRERYQLKLSQMSEAELSRRRRVNSERKRQSRLRGEFYIFLISIYH